MSRLGKIPLIIPSNIKIILTRRTCKIQGPYGMLIQNIPKQLNLYMSSNKLFITKFQRINNKNFSKQQGLIRSLLKNIIKGVIFPFEITLQIIGVGYRAMIQQQHLILTLGYSHKVVLLIPTDLSLKIVNNIYLIIQGINKKLVSFFGSKIRAFKPPEPYKGTGIKYLNEIIIRKIGKSTNL
uniref:Ribosomal protein L6 n=1 Tax=Pteridomonas sp. YPF1301 TaxID=2766739 RepID=A0A7G1MNI8_9STRA|nr:ribosomal protein L6 [Pteridomonas sp. YPF1301]